MKNGIINNAEKFLLHPKLAILLQQNTAKKQHPPYNQE